MLLLLNKPILEIPFLHLADNPGPVQGTVIKLLFWIPKASIYWNKFLQQLAICLVTVLNTELFSPAFPMHYNSQEYDHGMALISHVNPPSFS